MCVKAWAPDHHDRHHRIDHQTTNKTQRQPRNLIGKKYVQSRHGQVRRYVDDTTREWGRHTDAKGTELSSEYFIVVRG